MKRFLLVMAAFITVCAVNAQLIKIELWAENYPLTYQCHWEGDGGDYGKCISDRSLEFWQDGKNGIAMRENAEVTYTKGRTRYYSFIYHGRRLGNKIIFTTQEDGDAMDGTGEPEKLDKPLTLVIDNPHQVSWDGLTYTKMKYDYTVNKWVRD